MQHYLKKISVLILLLLNISLFSQELLHCGADELRIKTLKQHPEIAKAVIKRDNELNAFTKHYIQNTTNKTASPPLYIIPVVFHVIHNYGIENISNAQVIDGLNVLNKLFRKQMADTASIVAAFKPLHADCEIEFRLASKDPDGNCHSGINRIASPLTYTGDHAVKSLVQWPQNKYLNIYIVANAAGLAGHCVWPSDADTIPQWDGIVMSHNYIGSIGTSQPLTSVVIAHEVGHYLNLQHIWGGNNVPGFYFLPCADPNKSCSIDDGIADTPPTIGWQYCNLTGASCGNTVDNVQNMMDYSYCNKMFTYGQKAHMHACLNSPIAGRNNLWQLSNLIATGTDTLPSKLCKADFTSDKTSFCQGQQVRFNNESYNGPITSYQWSFPGGTPTSATTPSVIVTYTIPGTYNVSLKVKHNNDSTEVLKNNLITVLSNTTTNTYPYSESFETPTTFTTNWTVFNVDTLTTFEPTNATAVTGNNCLRIDNFNNVTNRLDELWSPLLNLSNASGNLTLSFKYAFARKDTSSKDELILYHTKTCDNSWVKRWNAKGSALETTTPNLSVFIPTATEWKEVNVSIPQSYATTASAFRFKFMFTSGGGNNLYIDDINIDISTGLFDLHELVQHLRIAPNPTSDNGFLYFNLNQPTTLKIVLTNTLGETVQIIDDKLFFAGENKLTIPRNNLKSGIYFINMTNNGRILSKPIIFD